MDRTRTANILIFSTAVLFLLTGAVHLAAFASINSTAQGTTPEDARVLLPLLWLAVGIDHLAFGLIVGAVALENSTGGRYVLAAAALGPWGAAILQLIYLGFIPPTALLLLDGALAIACAIVREPRRRRSTTGA